MMNRILSAAAAFAALVAATVAQAEPVKIRVGYGEVPGVITPLLFIKKDLLKHYGKSYTVESAYFQATSVALQAMAAGELDISYLAFSSLGLAIQNGGIDIKVISDQAGGSRDGYQGPEYLVLDDAGINTIADLKGKVLATSARGSGFHYAMLANLKKAGLSDKTDFTVVEVRLPAMEATLRQKKVDLITSTAPFLQMARERGGVRTLFKAEDGMGDLQSLLNVARADFLKQNSKVIVDFLEDYITALQWFQNPANHKEAVEITAAFTKRPVAALEGWVFTKGDYYRNPTATPDIVALQRNLDTVYDLGVFRSRIDVAPFVDLSYLEQAKKNLGLSR